MNQGATILRIATFSLLSFILMANLGLTTTVLAAGPLTDYTLIEPLPLSGTNQLDPTTNAATYIPGLFKLALAIASVLAVIMLIYAGLIYMSTDAYYKKNEAKGIIQNVAWGMALTFGAWVIVATLISPTNGAFTFSLDLDLGKDAIDTSSTVGGGGGNGTGCQGTCQYSYTNSDGDTVKYNDCSNCSLATGFGLDIKNTAPNGKPAQLNINLGNKLKAVQDTSGNPPFRVTETWPPTTNHRDQGQYNGTSVDIGLNTISAENIKTFIKNAEAKGLTAMYEVTNADQRNSYMSAGVPPERIIVVPYINKEHFSVK